MEVLWVVSMGMTTEQKAHLKYYLKNREIILATAKAKYVPRKRVKVENKTKPKEAVTKIEKRERYRQHLAATGIMNRSLLR